MCIEQKVIVTCSISPRAVKQFHDFFNTSSSWQDWTKLHYYVLQCKKMAWAIPAVSSTHFSESRAVYFLQYCHQQLPVSFFAVIVGFYFRSMIALGELIAILNMVFLPASPQGKEKIKNEAWNYNQAWHMYGAWPSLGSQMLWLPKPKRNNKVKRQKYEQCGTWLVTTQQENVLLQKSLKRTKLLLSKDRENYLQDGTTCENCNTLQN